MAEIFVDDNHTQRDVVSHRYQIMASNAQAIGAMLTKIPRDENYTDVLELAAKADAAVQRLHDAMGCMVLDVSIRNREEQNAADRELLRETRRKLKGKK